MLVKLGPANLTGLEEGKKIKHYYLVPLECPADVAIFIGIENFKSGKNK